MVTFSACGRGSTSEGYGVLAQKDVGGTCWSFGLHTEHSLDWPLVLRSQQHFATCS